MPPAPEGRDRKISECNTEVKRVKEVKGVKGGKISDLDTDMIGRIDLPAAPQGLHINSQAQSAWEKRTNTQSPERAR